MSPSEFHNFYVSFDCFIAMMVVITWLKGLDKCKRFIGFEIFVDYDEEALSKLVDFNIQGNNIYYGGLYKEGNKLICPNYVEPSELFNDLYNTILTDLDITLE